MKTVLITGGTGFIGSYLSGKLRSKGYRVHILSRTKNRSPDGTVYRWNVETGMMEKESIIGADYIVHLAGENIFAKRWTSERMQQIIESRVKTSRFIFKKVKEYNVRPAAFISASAVGYYGAVTSDKIFSETDEPANDFLGEVCQLWENAADQFSEAGIRTVKIRTSPVLASDGGVLARMVVPVKCGLAAALGSGKQYFPWIHIDDLCAIYIKAIEDETMNGAYNAVAPGHVTNKAFTKALARALKKPFWLPDVPAWILKLIFGERSVLFVNGSRASSERIRKAGFVFRFPDLKSALQDLFGS